MEAWVRQNCTLQFPVSKILLTAPLFCQCTTVNTDNTFPSNLNDLAHDMTVFSIYLEVIFELIKSLDPNKVHGYDGISVKTLKSCGPSICEPVTLIFESFLASGHFSDVSKKSLVHKKGISN